MTNDCRGIRNREHDLHILSQISPDQYFAFEKLRHNRAAKTIQRTWRDTRILDLRPKKSSLEDYYNPKAKFQSFGYKTVKVDRYREDGVRKSRELYASLSKNDPLLEKVEVLYKDMVSTYEAKVDPSFSPRVEDRLDIKPEDVALGLDQLFQTIRAKALQRQTVGVLLYFSFCRRVYSIDQCSCFQEEGKSNITSFGNYRELIKQRQRMEILLSEYYGVKEDSEFNKVERVKSLLRAQRLMDDVRSLPSLDDVAAMIDADDKGKEYFSTLDAQQKKRITEARKWLDSHPEDFTSYIVSEDDKLVRDLDGRDVVRKTMYSHLQMTNQLTEARWKTFLLPVHVQRNDSSSSKNGKSESDPVLRDSLCVEETLDKPPRFVLSALPTKFDAIGTSAEDSLKWVSYCLNGITNETVPKELKTLRNRVLHSALHPNSYREEAEKALERDYAEVREKAKIIEQRVLLELKAQAMAKLGKAFALSTRQQQEHAATVIQAAMRSFLTRKHIRDMITRRRIDQALHQLLHEVSQLDGNKDDRFSRLSSILHQPHAALNSFLPQPPVMSTAGKQRREEHKQREKEEAASAKKLDPVQASLERYTLRSMLSPLKPPSNNQFTPQSSSHGPSLGTKTHSQVPPLTSLSVPGAKATPVTTAAHGRTPQTESTPAIRSIWEDRRLYEADAKEQKLADETPLHKRGDLRLPTQTLQQQSQQPPILSAFSTSAQSTARRPEPPILAPPSANARSIKSVQFANQVSSSHSMGTPGDASPPVTARGAVRTPSSARGTPKTRGVPSSTISSAGGDILSPFMGLDDLHGGDEEGYGYISTPSLSRSLTESFGKVDTSGEDKT